LLDQIEGSVGSVTADGAYDGETVYDEILQRHPEATNIPILYPTSSCETNIHPNASAETRKRILRTVVSEVVACVEGDQIHLKLHWHGGDHTALVVPRRRRGYHRFVTDTNTTELIRSLARLIPDASIAALLNRLGKRTVKGNTLRGPRPCFPRRPRY
jgi:hypothetical protein